MAIENRGKPIRDGLQHDSWQRFFHDEVATDVSKLVRDRVDGEGSILFAVAD